MQIAPGSRRLPLFVFLVWHVVAAPPADAGEVLRRSTVLPAARVLRGGPHGPDGRPYDADRTVRVPDAAKARDVVHERREGARRMVIAPSAQLTRATPPSEHPLAAGPRIQPLYLEGCSSEDYAVAADLGKGSGRQRLQLIVDSGSSTLAVASDKCRNCEVTATYALKSGTTKNTQVQAQYGSGAWRGVIVDDTVALGFAPARRMAFGDILAQDGFFRQSSCTFGERGPGRSQGIVGMGPSDLLLPGTASYFMSITPGLQEPVYSVALCDVDGFLHLGPPPPEARATETVYTPMVPSYYYAVALADLEVGSRPLGRTYDDFGPAVVDTGTSAIILPPRAYAAFTKAVAAATDNALPPSFFDDGDCIALPEGTRVAQLDSELPAMGFAFYDPATPKEPAWVSLPATNSYLLLLADAKQQTIACAGVMSSCADYPQTILGNTIMRNMLTTFDVANGRIGFAPSDACR